MERMAISQFKATCLAVLQRVAETKQPVVVTKRGKPIARIVPTTDPVETTSAIGCMAGTAEELGDIVAPLDWRWDAGG